MELISLKRDKKAVEEKATDMPVDVNQDEYPYGLRITLDGDTLKKLGIDDATKHDVDEPGMLHAKYLIKRVSKSKDDYGNNKTESQSIEIQLTDICLEDGEGEESLGWDDDKNSADGKLKKRNF